MFKSIHFYSYFGNGDLFNTRNVIKYIMRKFPETGFFYAHSKSVRMFEDIDSLSYERLHESIHVPSSHVTFDNGNAYINTWIGLDSRFVLPGIGCVLLNYLNLFGGIFRWLNVPNIFDGADIDELLPTIDWSKLSYKGNVDSFIQQYQTWPKKLLISTNPVQSCQAENFDMMKPLKLLVERFPEWLFIATERPSFDAPNLVNTTDIIQAKDGFDLNEIGYLSLWTDIIVGRSSGPYVFTQVRENYDNPTKKTLSFTYHINAADLAKGIPTKIQKYWSGETSTEGVASIIGGLINE